MDAPSDLRAIAERSVHIMATGDRADFAEIIHPDGFNHEQASEPPACRGKGPGPWYEVALWLRAAFADLAYTIDHGVTEGDLVVLRTTMTGRHVGLFVTYDADGRIDQVFPPTGRTFAATQSHWLRITDGKVIEHWANRDDLGQAFQLGWVPPTPRYLLRMARARRGARQQAART